MNWFRRLKGRNEPPADGQSPGLFPVGHDDHRTYGIDRRVAEARAAGDEDARAGVLNQWTRAVKPAALRSIEAEREQNLAFLRGVTDAAEAAAEARAADADRQQDQLAADLAIAEAEKAAAADAFADLPEARHGWLRIHPLILGIVSVAILGADIIFTRLALENSLGNLFTWEAWTVAVLIGALLFIAGVGEAYIENACEVAIAAGERPPFGARAKRRLELAIFIPTVAMLFGLAAARWSLIDTGLSGGEWVAAIGSFAAIVTAALLVAVVAYLGARVLLAARPRAAAHRAVKKATARVGQLTQAHLAAQLAADEAKAHAQGTRPNYESAVRAAEEAWMQVICAYWRGFSLVRPDEQPDIDAINRITNASRPIHLDEVMA